MTVRSPKSSAIFALIQSEFDKIDKELSALKDAQDALKNEMVPPQIKHIVMVGIASTIEKTFTGAENILRRIAAELDGYVPSGDAWHKDLIDQMAMTIDERDAVLNDTTAQTLHDMRMFRHRERNSYGFMLNEYRVLDLADEIASTISSLKMDIAVFQQKMQKPIPIQDNDVSIIARIGSLLGEMDRLIVQMSVFNKHGEVVTAYADADDRRIPRETVLPSLLDRNAILQKGFNNIKTRYVDILSRVEQAVVLINDLALPQQAANAKTMLDAGMREIEEQSGPWRTRKPHSEKLTDNRTDTNRPNDPRAVAIKPKKP